MYNVILNILTDLILVTLLVLCAFEDARRKIIPNKYTVPAILIGVILMTMNNGFLGFKDSLIGFAFGFLIFLIPFVFGLMGAGDVKLMAAIGALKGFTFTVSALLASGLVGGIITIIYIVYKKQFVRTLVNMFGMIFRPISKSIYLKSGNITSKRIYDYFENKKLESSNLYIPYAIPIAIGTLGVLFINYFSII